MLYASLTAKAEREAEQPLDRIPLRPSAAGYCARRLAEDFYDYRQRTRRAAEVKSPETMLLLDFGNSVEYHIIRQFQQMSLEDVRSLLPELKDLTAFRVAYKQQVLDFGDLTEGERMEGSTDMVFISNISKGILDAKSKKDKFWEKWKTDWDKWDLKLEGMATVERHSKTLFWVNDLVAFLDELDDPFFRDNFVQLNFYACTEFVKQRGIDHGAILQYNKNASRMREIRFRPSQEVYDYVKTKFHAVQQAVDVDGDPQLVPKEYEKDSFLCRYCPWSKRCWGKGGR